MASGSEYTVKIIIDSKDQTSGPAGKATKSLGNLQTAAKLAAGAFVALKGAQKAVDFVKLGASIQATEDRFYKFVGNAAEADKMLRALGDASDHTMTRMGKLDTASQLFSLGLATTADEMEIAGGMIGKLGKASLSTEGRMNSLTMLLANQSTRRLDDFSLSVEEVTARQRDLEAQGLSTEQAFKTAVYDIATKKIITLGDTSQLAATKIAKTEASLTDTKNALAEMTTAVLNASGALDKTATWATNTADAANAIRDHGFSLKAWADGVFTFIKTSGDGEQAIAAFTEEVSKAEPVNERLRQATMVANDAFEEWQTEARLAAEATVNMSTAVENLDLGTVDFIDDLTEAESNLAMYEGALGDVSGAYQAQLDAIEDAAHASRTYAMDAAADWTAYAKDATKTAEELAADKEKIEQTHIDKLAGIQAKGQARAINLDIVSEQEKLERLEYNLGQAILKRSEMTGKERQSTVNAKEHAVATLTEQVEAQKQLMDDYYGGRLVQAGQNVDGLLAEEQRRYDAELVALTESRTEQEIAQKESLGRMVVEQWKAYALGTDLGQEEIDRMTRYYMEKYGIIAEGGQAAADAQAASFKLAADIGVEAFGRLKASIDAIPRHINIDVSVQGQGLGVSPGGGAGTAEQAGIGMASGGYSSGGMAMVGELGPEMVRLPRGSHVTPASQVNDNRTYHFDQVVNTRATTHNLMNDFALAQAMAG